MHWLAFPLALLPAVLHWWWTRSVLTATSSAVLPERHLAVAQRVSFVSIVCVIGIIMMAGWHALWLLPVQFVALTATSYRARLAMFGETWPFHRYLSWRLRLHAGMFGLWWFVALAPVAISQASPDWAWWISAVTAVLALAWHHWSGRILLVLLRASRVQRPDLEAHFQRVFAGARVAKPDLWRAGVEGGRLANAFALATLNQRGVLFFDSLLEQLPPEEITAILAHEVAHLEQFHRRRVIFMYFVTTLLMLLFMFGSAVTSVFAQGFELWSWVVSGAGVFGALMIRARRLQAYETDADRRAIELCGDPDALIRALTRIYEINHIPRRWSALTEERATHPSLARRIRTIRELTAATHAAPEPIERLVVPSSTSGRCAVIDHHRIAFVWIDGELGDTSSLLERAHRVEMISYDQLSELRVAAKRGAIELVAVGRQAGRWSMPIGEADAARVQATLDRVDHLFVAPAPRRDYGIARRVAVLLVILLAAPYNAIGAVIVPALLALRRPKRPMMLALAAALAGTAIASVNDLDASVVRFVLLAILTLIVVVTVGRHSQQEDPDAPLWTWIERLGLLAPVLVGVVFAAANARDLFGLHSALRDRAWFTAGLAAMAVFQFVQVSPRTSRRAGLGIAVLATATFIVGSPWFLLHAVADPLVADMPLFRENTLPVTALATQSVNGSFNAVQLTPNGMQFVLTGDYTEVPDVDDDTADSQPTVRFVAGGFDGWQRELRAYGVAVIDDQRLLVLDRDRKSSRLRAEDLRSGDTLWTITLPDTQVSLVQASPDGRWRAVARNRDRFNRLDGQVGSSTTTSTQWSVAASKHSYVDVPRSDGGNVALAVAPLFEEPALSTLLSDWRETTKLLRVDSAHTTELATSNLRVECPLLPIDVTGYVCLSFDGRSTRFWRIELTDGRLVPLAEARAVFWKSSRTSQQRIAGVANGRPILADLDSHTAVTLISDTYCWAQDVAVTESVVATCSDGESTKVVRYRLPDVH